MYTKDGGEQMSEKEIIDLLRKAISTPKEPDNIIDVTKFIKYEETPEEPAIL